MIEIPKKSDTLGDIIASIDDARKGGQLDEPLSVIISPNVARELRVFVEKVELYDAPPDVAFRYSDDLLFIGRLNEALIFVRHF